MVRFLISFTLVLFIVVSPVTTYGIEVSELNIQTESTNPDSPNYFIKRLVENLKLTFIYRSREQKAKFLSRILDSRFKEMIYTIKKEQIGIVENITSRYNSTVGNIIDNYKAVDSGLPARAKEYLPTLAVLRDHYPANSAQWLLFQQTIDMTNKLIY